MSVFRSLREWADYVKGLRTRLNAATQRGTLQGAEKCLPLLRDRTEQAGADVTHEFIRGWRVFQTKRGVAITNIAPHAPYVEYGRKPGRMPPVDAITLWVALKFGIGGMEARKMAWAIAKKIEQRGVEGKHILRKARWKIKQVVMMEILRETMAEFRRKK